MAQILKFSAGGKSNKTYSNTLTLNNTEYAVTDDLLNKFYAWGDSAEDEGVKYQYYKIADALKAGESINLSGKSMFGNVEFDVSNLGEKRMQKGVKWALGREEDARKAIDHANKFTYTVPEPEKTKYDWSKKLTANYDVKTVGKGKNAKTTKTWIESLDNNEFLKRMDLWKSIALGTNDDIELIGLDGVTVKQLRDHYNALGSENFDALRQRIKDGTADKKDHEILKAYNLFLLDEPKPATQTKGTSSGSTKINGSLDGYHEGTYPKGITYRGLKQGETSPKLFYINPTTKQITFNDSGLLEFLKTTPNIWINESFVSAFPQYGEILKYFPKGVFILNGNEIYDASNIESLKDHQIFKDFVLRNKETAGSSNEVIKQWWNPEKDEIFQKIGETVDTLGNDLNGKYIRELSWKYGKLPTITSIDGATYNPSYLVDIYPEQLTDNMFDAYGHILPEYIQKRAYGNNDNRWIYTNITSNGNFLQNLQQTANISTVQQQQNKRNNSFIVPSVKIGDKYYDTLLDTPNYKLFRDSSGHVRIAITKNGQWRWFKITNQNIVNELNVNPRLFNVDYFRANANGNFVEIENAENLTNKFILKGEQGLKVPYIPKSLADFISSVDFTKKPTKASYISGYDDNVDLYDITDPDRFMKDARNQYLEKLHNDKIALYNPEDTTSKLNRGKPEIITTNYAEDLAKRQYGSKDFKFNFRFRPDDALAIADLITSFTGNKKAIDKQKEAIWNAVTYKNVPILQRPLFSDNGLMHQKQAAINRITNTPIRYSDAALNMSDDLVRASSIENIHSNANAQLSDLYSKYKNSLLDIANKESALHTEADYENRKMYNTAKAATTQYDASRITANGESLKKFIYEQREKVKQDLSNLQSIALAEKQGEFESAMKTEFEKRGGWSQIKDEELRNMLMENANYEAAMRHVNPQFVSDEYAKLVKDVKLDPTYRQSMIPYWMYGKNYTTYNKKGGKVKNVFHDAFLEDIKATNKALDSLHKDIRKLLLRLVK